MRFTLYEKSERVISICDFELVSIFFRTSLCVSAVFAVAQCLSARLSVCHVGGLYPDS